MSTFNDTVTQLKNEMAKLGLGKPDDTLFESVAKGVGPALYNKDASTVSCSDSAELERVKNNFLIKKLGLGDSPALMNGIKEVCEAMGTSNRNKYRAIFYYLLVKKFGKESAY